jgi:hypothetical protein
MGGDAEKKKKKGVQDLNLGYSILFKGVEYIYINFYTFLRIQASFFF